MAEPILEVRKTVRTQKALVVNSYYNILNHGEMTINPNVEISQNGHYSSMIANGYYVIPIRIREMDM